MSIEFGPAVDAAMSSCPNPKKGGIKAILGNCKVTISGSSESEQISVVRQLVQAVVKEKLNPQQKSYIVDAVRSWKHFSSLDEETKEGGLAAAAVDEVAAVEGQSTTSSLPSVSELMARFRGRSWGAADDTVYPSGSPVRFTTSGFLYTDEQHGEDQAILEKTLDTYNVQFKNRLDMVTPDMSGLMEKIDVPSGTEFFVRADVHSDLATLMLELDMLKDKGYLDENYHCREGFHMLFLGDYTDRGHNDIEVLTLLLKLRMENPTQVHLIRGNHENVGTQMRYSPEKEWLSQHYDPLEQCYKTMPLAFCVAGEEGGSRPGKEGRKEYAHFSHGLISTLVDPIPFLEGRDDCVAIRGCPDPSIRLKKLSKDGSRPKAQAAAQVLLDAQASEKAVLRSQGVQDSEMTKVGYTWSSVGMVEDLQESQRGIGSLIPVDIVRAYEQAGGEKAVIKAIFHGHEHTPDEISVATKGLGGKTVVTGLAVGTLGGFYITDPRVGFQSTQGLLLKVAPHMRGWQKSPVVTMVDASGAPSFDVGAEKGMYDTLP